MIGVAARAVLVSSEAQGEYRRQEKEFLEPVTSIGPV
jgi:hypothetical protein